MFDTGDILWVLLGQVFGLVAPVLQEWLGIVLGWLGF